MVIITAISFATPPDRYSRLYFSRFTNFDCYNDYNFDIMVPWFYHFHINRLLK